MESNNNNNSDEGDEHQHQQLRGNARKRQFNELANDVDQPADEDQPEPEDCNSSKKNREEGKGSGLLDLELENLSREELIKFVRKQMTVTMEAQKQLETTKKEAEGSAKQAEELSQRNIQLEQEKAELHANLYQKMAEIVDMHKEVEEKSKKLTEKASQINALLIQFNESTSHRHQMPTEQQEQMKIQLSLETWYDWLSFVPRHRLGQVLPMIGDRKFASIVQKFLHEYGEITIGHIEIVAPYEEDPNGHHPRVRTMQNDRLLRFEMAEVQMPANIKNFKCLGLSYFDQSVLSFMQKFQQNGLLDNVNLFAANLSSKDIVQPVLCHLLPLINGIVSIEVDSAQFVNFYDAGNSKEIYEMNIKMMEKTRFLVLNYDHKNLDTKTIDLYCRWLYQTAHTDGKPQVLEIKTFDMDSTPISLFIDRIKQDFQMAINPVTFFIRINLQKAFQSLEAICLDNGKTKERLVTKMEVVPIPYANDWVEFVLLISRYPLASTKKWIDEKEKEVLNWDFDADKTIHLSDQLKVVPI